MSFLNELKSQAQSLQNQQQGDQQSVAANTEVTEIACKVANKYLQDLCAQLNVITPPAHGSYSLDGKAPWPALKLSGFRCDARKKMLRAKEAFDYIAVGWNLTPSTGQIAHHSLTVNFPPELERVQQRLSVGQIRHERKDIRHPESNKLQAYVFDYDTASSGSITLTPEHDTGQVAFRVCGVGGFQVLSTRYPANKVNQSLLDELAKYLVGQTSRFG
jgi:hypothetical protein